MRKTTHIKNRTFDLADGQRTFKVLTIPSCYWKWQDLREVLQNGSCLKVLHFKRLLSSHL